MPIGVIGFEWTTPGRTKAFPLAAREEVLARVAGWAPGQGPDARPARGPARSRC
ncbi:hypothetical protein [Streptomyces sp. NPDC005828]|uniref:hypothetical protein n=1 Tax=Streptomyces sp. NPDC005828 TaxID=3157071 RepID=UPI0033DC7969